MNGYPMTRGGIPSLFDGIFSEIEPLFQQTGLAARTVLPLDVEETQDGYTLLVNVPGVTRDNIDLSMEGEELTITVSASEEKSEGKRYLHRERSELKAKRIVALPDASDQVEAALKDGVLTIQIKKDQGKLPRKISIS